MKSLLGVGALLTTVALVGSGQVASAGGTPTVPPAGVVVDKVDLCHRTDSHSNPYNTAPSVSVSSIVPVPQGHTSGPDGVVGLFTDGSTPWGDIIPPFTWNDGVADHTFAGQNWTSTGEAIFRNGCALPNPTTVTPLAPTVAQSVCTGAPPAPSTPTYTINAVTGVIYSVGGKQVTGTNNATAGSTVTVDVDAMAGYVLAAGAPTSYLLTFTAAPNCTLPAVTPLAPTVSQSVCVGTTPSTPSYVIPTVTGVVYSQAAGSHPATPGSTVTITAAADATHSLAPGAPTSFTLTFNAAPNCSNVVIPTAPDLSIVKAGPTAAVLPGAQVAYTLTVRNNGTAPAANVTVTDPLATGLTLVSASGTGWVCGTGGTVSCQLSGLLGVGSSAVLNVLTTLSSSYGAATVVNTAVVTPTDATPADNSSTATTPVVGNLGISKTGTGSLFPGDELVWTLTVTNTRGTPATAFTVTDTLPAGTSYSSAAGTDFTCTNTGQDVSCVYGGSLAVGSSAQIVVRALLSATYTAASVSNTAVVDPGRPDSDSADNSSTFVSTVTFSGGGGGEVVVPTPSPSVSPAVSPSPSPNDGGGGALPFTGLPADRLLTGGVILLLVGLVLALGVRRRATR